MGTVYVQIVPGHTAVISGGNGGVKLEMVKRFLKDDINVDR